MRKDVRSLQLLYSNVNALGGETPLTISSYWGHMNIVRLLLDNGANPGLVSHGHLTPLMIASMRGHLAVVETILRVLKDDQTGIIDSRCDDHHGGMS